MIVCYQDNPAGKINHVIFDPVQTDIKEHYLKNEQCILIENGPDKAVIMDHFFVKAGKLAPRPRIRVPSRTLEIDAGRSFNMPGIPPGCIIRVGGQEFVCEDTQLILEMEDPGEYTVELDYWPYMDAQFKVNVLPAGGSDEAQAD